MNSKSYEIVINGKSYDVEVIAKGGRAVVSSMYEAMVQPVAAAAPAAPAAQPAPAAAASAPKAAPAAGDTVIDAPMPGTIVGINCKVGDHVKANTVVVVLEALKMENEIFAGKEGVVKDICVTKGQSVEAGDAIVVLG